LAKDKVPDLEVEFTGFCKSFPEENMGQLKFWTADAGGKYSNGSELPARGPGTGRKSISLKEYDTLESMLKTEKPDILVVDNRFAERYQAEKMAILNGANVFADKPIAMSEDELVDLYACANKAGKILWTMHTVRYDPWYYTAWKLIQKGAIGKVRMVNCRKSYRFGKRLSFYKDRKYYGGTFGWVTIHAIDMIRMATGKECLSVYALSSVADNFDYGDMEVITTSSFELEDDILATITTDYYRPENAHSHDDDRMRVVGTKGIVEVSRRDGDHEVRLINKDSDGKIPIPQEKPPFIFEDFVRTIQGKGAGLLNMEESVCNAYVAVCAQRSADEKSVIKMKNAKILFPGKKG
jgi:predicted dehydrogenase